MRKILILAALIPSLASAAAATWAPVSTTALCDYPGRGWSNANCRSVIGTCSGGGTCADFPANLATTMNLSTVGTVRVKVCPAAANQLTGGSVVLWTLDGTGLPAKWITLTVPAVATNGLCAELEGNSPGLGIPVLGARGYLIPVPAVTVNGGGITIVVTASGYANQAL